MTLQLVEFPIKKLRGPALHWAVAKALKYKVEEVTNGVEFFMVDVPVNQIVREFVIPFRQHHSLAYMNLAWNPSTDWNHLGPILMTNAIMLGTHINGTEDDGFEEPWGSAHCFLSGTTFDTYDGMMVAACRALVAYDRVLRTPYNADKTVVEIPTVLLNADGECVDN